MRARLGGPVHPLSPRARGQHCRWPTGPVPGLNLPRTPSSRPAGPAASQVLLQKKAPDACGWQLSPGWGVGRAGGSPLSRGRGQGPAAAPAHSPRKGTPACLASSSPPPLEKMLVHSWDTETRGPPPSSLPTVGRALAGGGAGRPHPRPPRTHRAVGADKATHVLHEPDHPQPHLPAEGQLPPHVPHRHRLETRKGAGAADGRGGHSRACPGARAPVREQYLGRGDHEGPQGAVGAQGVHHGHVLIRGPRGRVHNQAVQLPPGHIRHELLYQRCGDPGRRRTGGGRWVGRASPGPHLLPSQGRATFGPAAHSESCVCHCAPGAGRDSSPARPQDFCSGPSFGHMSVPQRDGLWGTRAWPGSTPRLGPAPTPGSPVLALRGSQTPFAGAKAPEPVRAPHRAPSCLGEDQAAEGFTAEAHALTPQANCLRTCRLNGSGLGGVSWK